MQTNNIEEAKIVNENDDLMARLNQATEEKKPSTENKNTGWSFDDEDKTQPPAPEIKDENFNTPPAQPTAQSTTSSEPTSEPKISKDLKIASARITVSALDSTQRMIFSPLINRKYSKKFTDDEIKRLDESEIIDEEKSRLDIKDLPLRNKFDRLMKKRDKKLKDIPFTELESQDLEKIFYQYMDAKNKTLPPELMLGISIANVLGKRAIDLFTE